MREDRWKEEMGLVKLLLGADILAVVGAGGWLFQTTQWPPEPRAWFASVGLAVLLLGGACLLRWAFKVLDNIGGV